MRKIALFLFLIGLLSVPRINAQTQNCLTFDGTDDNVIVPNNANLDGGSQFTCEAWINITALNKVHGIMAKRTTAGTNGWSLLVFNADNKVYFKVSTEGNVFSSTTVLTTNRWYHVAAVFDGTLPAAQREKIYINGVLENTGSSTSTTVASTTGDMYIGALPVNATSWLKGQMDEVKFYKGVALTASQIQADMCRELTNVTAPEAYYQFNASSGATVADVSGHGHDGVATGDFLSTSWHASTAPVPYYSIAAGNWNANATWAAGQFAPTATWARVKTLHNVAVTASATAEEVTVAANTLTVNSGVTLTVNSALTNSATITDNGTITSSGTLTNNASSGITIASGQSLSTVTTSNSGTITNNGTLTSTGTYSNSGTTTVASGATFSTNNTSNSGTLTDNGGITSTGTLTNTATGGITIASGKTLSTVTTSNSGTVTNNGTLTSTGTYTNSGTTTIASGATFGTNNTSNSGTLTDNGGITSTGTLTNTATGGISIASGKTLSTVTTSNSGTITNDGTLTSTGTFTNNSGGTTTVATGASFSTATTSNSGTITDNGTLTSSAAYTINSGGLTNVGPGATFTSNGTTALGSAQCLVLKSDATGTASFIDNGTISGSGTAKIQRYLTPYDVVSDLKFHFISSPVSSTLAIEPEFIDFSSPAITDFYKWDEPTNTWINFRSGVYTVRNASFGDGFNFVPGKGYMVAYPAAITKNFVGTPFTGSLVVNCTSTLHDWNLIGNPYPSSIDWDAVTKGSGMDNALYYYDNATLGYQYYIPLTGPLGTATKYIAPMQGVMVHAKTTGTKTVTFTNSARTHTGANVFYKDAPLTANVLDLKVEGNGKTDYSRVCFYNQATANYDGDFDAFKLLSSSATVSELFTTSADSKLLSINTLPMDVMEGGTVPVSFKVGTDGEYKITADKMNSFDASTYITLEDKKTNTLQKLNDNPVYTFSASTLDSSDRFVLHFKNATLVPDPTSKENTNIYVSNGNIVIAAQKAINADILVSNMIGQEILRSTTNGKAVTTINANGLSNGVYVVSLIGGNKVSSQKIVINK